jgi:hypothetical protein
MLSVPVTKEAWRRKLLAVPLRGQWQWQMHEPIAVPLEEVDGFGFR